jgi:hypothetical protein
MMFKTIKVVGDWWGVFLVNPTDPRDKYLVTGTFDKEKYADQFRDEFNRIGAMYRDE